MTRLVHALPALTLLAVLTVTASSEYTLATTVLALQPWIAWGVPAAIDSYVVAAVRTGRDVGAAMTVMALSLFAAAGSHQYAAAHDGRLPVEVAAPAGAVILSALVLVAWRVHVLIDRITQQPATTPAPALEPAWTNPVAPTVETPVTFTPRSDASPSDPEAVSAPAREPAPASPASDPWPDDLLTAAREVVEELASTGRAVNYKNLAPPLRQRGHQVGRAKAAGLLAQLAV